MYNMKRGEDTEQINVIEWSLWNTNRYPELAMLFHVPNGGKRSATEAARFKAMGVKAGVPDLCLPVPKGGYAGLWVEMKFGKNKTTDNQDKWLDALRKQGYATAICYNATEATETLEKYLKQKATILCDPEKAEPRKRMAVYCTESDKEAIETTLQMAVTEGSCIFGTDFEGCNNGNAKHCVQCIAENVEFNEYK